MSWQKKYLTEICKPKQWKVISQSELTDTGYLVYGANGKMGFYYEFNHETAVLLIGCRGSCGSIHISEPFSYTNGNAMACDELSPDVDIKFLKYFLEFRGFDDIISGGVQKQITIQGLNRVEIPLPPLATQKRIAEILDAADALRRKDQELLKKYDELAQAIFIDMFGDPVKNEKGWDVKKLKDFGSISTGNTPSRADKTNFDSNYIEWIKTDNIGENKLFVTQSSEYLSEVGSKKGRITPKGSLLVACIAGSVESIGRAALTDRQVAFNQQINSIQPNSNVNAKFLYYLFKFSRKHIQNHASNGMKRMLSKGEFEKIKMILPELNVQNNFNKVIQQFEFQTDQLKDSNFKSMDLFNNLIQKAFKGELVS